MYDENTFKNYIFWLKVKRVFFMLIFSVVGAGVGIVISQLVIDLLLVVDSKFEPLIVAISTLLFFAISLIATAGTGKEVQEGYWKMAVLRKLTVISKKLDYLENLDTISSESAKIVQNVAHDINQEIPRSEKLIDNSNDEEINVKPKKELKINKKRISKKS